jgi:hypothetical protein
MTLCLIMLCKASNSLGMWGISFRISSKYLQSVFNLHFSKLNCYGGFGCKHTSIKFNRKLSSSDSSKALGKVERFWYKHPHSSVRLFLFISGNECTKPYLAHKITQDTYFLGIKMCQPCKKTFSVPAAHYLMGQDNYLCSL